MLPLNLSQHGEDFIIGLEGVELKAYKDSAGLWTIGIGHLLTRDELTSGKIEIRGTLIKYRDGLTKQKVFDLFEQDIRTYTNAVAALIDKKLSQNRFDALVSFTFNVGIGAFRNSTLRKKVNDYKFKDVPTEFGRWIYSGGKIVKGLKNRREAEIKLWNS